MATHADHHVPAAPDGRVAVGQDNTPQMSEQDRIVNHSAQEALKNVKIANVTDGPISSKQFPCDQIRKSSTVTRVTRKWMID